MNRLQHLVLCTSVIASTSCGVGSDDGSPVEVGTTTQEVRTRVHNSVMKDSSASMFIDTPTSFAYLDVWRTGRNAADLSYEVREVDISVEVCETYTYWDCPYPPPGCDPGAGGQGGYGGFPVGG
jgi:hypothetical protein